MSPETRPDSNAASLQNLFPWLVAALAFATYSGALGGGFVYDDRSLIQDNPWVAQPGHALDIVTRPLFGHVNEGESSHAYYRPVPVLAFRALYGLFGGSPLPFHLLNVALHLIASLVLFKLARRLFQGRRWERECAFAAAALFAVHPAPSEAVAWISGIMDVLSVTAGLGALVLLTGSVSRTRTVAAALTWLMALFSKEVALVVPALLLVFDLSRRSIHPERGASWWLRRYLPLAAVLAIYVVVRIAVMPVRPTSAHVGLSAVQILASALALFGRYVGLLAWPATLNVVHPFSPTGSLVAPAALVGGGCLALLGAALYYCRRTAIGVGAAWFVIALLPVLYVPMLGTSAFAERYAYLASAGFAICVAGALELSGALGALAHGAARVVVVLAVVAGLVRTTYRLPAWDDEMTLWTEAARIAPGEFVPHYNLGAELLRNREPDRALEELNRAVALRPGYAPAHNHLGVALAMMGRIDDSIDALTRASKSSPRDSNIQHNLGLALRRAGRLEEARASFERALEANPSRQDSRAALERLRRGAAGQAAGSESAH